MSKIEGLLNYHEVFLSVQGESTDAGIPCTFVRLYGCNVKCSFCDQPQCKEDRHKISVANMVSKIIKIGCPNVCITGGEPLIQSDSVYQLATELATDYNYNVSIETNGCTPIPDLHYHPNIKFVMDIKCPSSGVSLSNLFDNLMLLRKCDEVKFVISDRLDYNYMKWCLKNYPTSAKILVSPVFHKDETGYFISDVSKELVKWLLNDRLFKVRVQVQMHKVLNVL